MKKFAAIMILALGAYIVPRAFAQDHGEVGAYADYVRLTPMDTNNLGAGARVSFNVHPIAQLEAEMSYDFARTFNESFSLGPVGGGTGVTGVSRTNIRILHGLFGPKFQTAAGPVRVFGTIKGGFVNFNLDSRPATFATFTSSVQGLRDDNMNAAVYPGGGVEFFAGPIGIRAEAGDLIYFNHGAHNNLRIAAGPTIRF